MGTKILIITIISIAFISTIYVCAWKLGYHEGVTEIEEVCRKQKESLLSRHEQEVLHEILGKYTGNYTDNDSYEFDVINELFR